MKCEGMRCGLSIGVLMACGAAVPGAQTSRLRNGPIRALA